MGKKIKLFSKRIIIRLFQLLGISSLLTAFGCGNTFLLAYGTVVPEPVEEYGVPANYFTLEGKVEDEEHNPIKGIRIDVQTHINEYNEEQSTIGFGYSNEYGYYIINWHTFDTYDLNYIITAEDVDGEENGSYNNKYQIIDYKDGRIDTRKYKKSDITLTLSKKGEE